MKARAKAKAKAKKSPAPRVLSESREQSMFVERFRLVHKNVIIMAIPNGGKIGVIKGAKLKKEGTLAGVPDLFVPEWSLWVEMKKSKGGKLTPAQEKLIPRLEAIEGHTVIIGRGAADAWTKVCEFLVERRSV